MVAAGVRPGLPRGHAQAVLGCRIVALARVLVDVLRQHGVDVVLLLDHADELVPVREQAHPPVRGRAPLEVDHAGPPSRRQLLRVDDGHVRLLQVGDAGGVVDVRVEVRLVARECPEADVGPHDEHRHDHCREQPAEVAVVAAGLLRHRVGCLRRRFAHSIHLHRRCLSGDDCPAAGPDRTRRLTRSGLTPGGNARGRGPLGTLTDPTWMPASSRGCDGTTPARWQAGRLSSVGNKASAPHGRRWRRVWVGQRGLGSGHGARQPGPLPRVAGPQPCP